MLSDGGPLHAGEGRPQHLVQRKSVLTNGGHLRIVECRRQHPLQHMLQDGRQRSRSGVQGQRLPLHLPMVGTSALGWTGTSESCPNRA